MWQSSIVTMSQITVTVGRHRLPGWAWTVWWVVVTWSSLVLWFAKTIVLSARLLMIGSGQLFWIRGFSDHLKMLTAPSLSIESWQMTPLCLVSVVCGFVRRCATATAKRSGHLSVAAQRYIYICTAYAIQTHTLFKLCGSCEWQLPPHTFAPLIRLGKHSGTSAKLTQATPLEAWDADARFVTNAVDFVELLVAASKTS